MQGILCFFYIDPGEIINNDRNDQDENINGNKSHVKNTTGQQKHYPAKSEREQVI
jgi:hypothetical protein